VEAADDAREGQRLRLARAGDAAGRASAAAGGESDPDNEEQS
jgi:hypothetical protein